MAFGIACMYCVVHYLLTRVCLDVKLRSRDDVIKQYDTECAELKETISCGEEKVQVFYFSFCPITYSCICFFLE